MQGVAALQFLSRAATSSRDLGNFQHSGQVTGQACQVAPKMSMLRLNDALIHLYMLPLDSGMYSPEWLCI